jgi:choline transporter-like protein 2/4/5
MLLVFVAFVTGMFLNAFVNMQQAGGLVGYKKITNGMQSDGRICGLPTDNQGAGDKYSNLFYYNAKEGLSLCVKTCPSSFSANGVEGNLFNGTALTGSAVRVPGYPTTQQYGYCFPDDGTNKTLVQKFKNTAAFQEAVVSVGKAYKVLIGAPFAAMLISGLFLLLIRVCGGVLVYGALLVVEVALLAGGYFAYEQSGKEVAGSSLRQNYQYTAYGVWIFAFIFLCICIFLRKRIRLAIAVLKEATLCIKDVPSMLFFPIIKFIAVFVFLAFWAAAAVYIAANGTITEGDSFTIEGITFTTKDIVFSEKLKIMFGYHCFSLLWVVAFLMAFAEFVLATASSKWYFTEASNGGGKDVGSPVSTGIWYGLRYHTGSLAFGSLLVAIVQMLRIVLEYIEKKVNQANGPNAVPSVATKVIKMVFCCCRCCLWCLEKCIKYINRNAYIMMALCGGSFCYSCKKSFHFIVRNAARLGTMTFIGNVFLFLGKWVVTASVTFLTYTVIVKGYVDPTLTTVNPLFPCILTGIASYLIGSLFMQVLSVTIDTLILCVIADEEMHDGHPLHAAQGIRNALSDNAVSENSKLVNNGGPVL